MAFDLCVIPASVVPYLSALKTRQFSMTNITAHLVSDKLTREQCRSMTPDTFASSHALHVRSSVSSEINLAITSSVSESAPSGHTIVIQGCLNDSNSPIVLGVCVSDEPIVADASLRLFVNIEETNNVFRLRADFDGMVTQGLLDDILEQSLEAYPTTAEYSNKKITFKNASNTALPNMEIDASAFIKDGMVNDVVIQNGNLVVSFNTDAGKEDISIPLSSIFDSGNYYTKTQTDTQISTAIDALGAASDNEYSKTFAGVWDDNSVDSSNYELLHVDALLSDQSDNVLVGLSKNSSKLVPLLVYDACHGAVTINPNLDWDSPVYVLFAGYRCFSAHPLVDFRQILKYENDSFVFTFSPMGSETPSVADGDDGNQYFGSANYPVFISDFNGSYAGYKSFCVGTPYDVNIPSSDLHWRLLGYTTSTPGYIRLTESHPFLKDFIYQSDWNVKLSKCTDKFYDSSIGKEVTPSQYVEHIQETKPEYNLTTAVQELVSNHGETVFHIKGLNASSVSASLSNGEVYVHLPHMTTIEFKDRVSFRTSTDEVAYIDRDGVYHGKAISVGYLRYYSTNVLSVESESVVTSNATVRPASSNSSLNLGTSTYKWGSVYATSLGDPFYPLTFSYSTSLYCTNVYSSGSSAVQCFTLGTNPDYANDISISGTDSDGSRGYLHPSVLHGADLGSFSKCFNKVWTKDIKAYGTIYGDLDGTATRATQATKATQDGSGNIITSTYIRDIFVDSSPKNFDVYTAAGKISSESASGKSYDTYLTLTKGSTSKSFRDLTGLVANIIAGTGTGTTVGNVRWVCCKTTGKWSKKDENIYMSGTILHPVDMTTSESGTACVIRFNASTSINNTQLSGVWRLLSCVGEISNGNMLVALAVRVY